MLHSSHVARGRLGWPFIEIKDYSRVDVQERALALGHMAFRAARLAEVCVVADPGYECWQIAPLYTLRRGASVQQDRIGDAAVDPAPLEDARARSDADDATVVKAFRSLSKPLPEVLTMNFLVGEHWVALPVGVPKDQR